MTRQSTRHIFLIEPAEFFANPETMETNVYQHDEHEPHDATFKKALKEFRAFRDLLVENGVFVTVAQGDKGCPDMLFPNWFSTHAGKNMILYPMLNVSRRAERAPHLIELLQKTYTVQHDLRDWEHEGQFIEATSSLIMDHVNKVAYVALSKRTSAEAARRWGKLMGYDIEIFETRSHIDVPVYHSDVLMWIGTDVAAICADCILPDYRDQVVARLRESRDVMLIEKDQLTAFCGNALEVRGHNDEKMLVMSSSAFEALNIQQKSQLNQHFKKILHTPLPTIQLYGGGAARCMMTELF